MKFVSRHTAAAVVASMLPILASAGPGGDSDDFTQLSLQQLMQVKVTSVSRKQQKLAHAAAAIYVLTQEEIKRSTATTIPELLRTIPGLQVARLDTGKWVVTARGFASEYANKLLVLIDGRTIYDPYFAGVRWDAQDTMLDDIDRIEVIRGPGATMWGSDAVNGVINIITKQARDTQGGLAAATTGSTDNALGNLRYGVKLGRNTYLRASSRYANRDALGGDTASTGWQTLRGAFRLDSDLSSRDALTVTGDWYGVRSGQQNALPVMEPPFVRTYANDARSDGRSVLGRWTHTVSEDSDLSAQFYWDSTNRRELILSQRRDTFDFDFQHRVRASDRHELLWGFGYRHTSDQTKGTFWMSPDREHRADQIFSGFVQDEISLIPERFTLIAGSKFEHNDYTGFEVQPTIRGLWTIKQGQSAWAGVSRAVRTPSRLERSSRVTIAAFPGPDGALWLTAMMPDQRFRSETIIAYETGYRAEISPRASIDVAAYYSDYGDLRSLRPGVPVRRSDPSRSVMLAPLYWSNGMHGKGYGVEASANWKIGARWTLSPGYAWTALKFYQDAGQDPYIASDQTRTPRHSASIRSYVDLPGKVTFDTAFYYTDAFWKTAADPYHAPIPSRLRADMRLARPVASNVEASLGIQDLFGGRHVEFHPEGMRLGVAVGRSVWVRLTWRF